MTEKTAPAKIAEFLVQIKEKEGGSLRQTTRPVNIRLLTENRLYRDLINKVCEYMELVIKQRYSDYNALQGLSGANVAVPFNIIAIIKDNEPVIMINPTIVKMSKNKTPALSNCGSLNLKNPVVVNRRNWVEVSYYDIEGSHYQKKFSIAAGGSTIQHEIDHNRGVLITDATKHL